MAKKETTGDRLKKLRKKHKLSQTELAEKVNLSPSAISKYERGRKIPDEMIETICKVLKEPVEYLKYGKISDAEDEDIPIIVMDFISRFIIDGKRMDVDFFWDEAKKVSKGQKLSNQICIIILSITIVVLALAILFLPTSPLIRFVIVIFVSLFWIGIMGINNRVELSSVKEDTIVEDIIGDYQDIALKIAKALEN